MFSLNWFKSRKQRQLEDLKVEEQRIKNELLRKELYSATSTPVEKTYNWVVKTSTTTSELGEKPYKTVKMVNNVLTVVLNDGSILSKPDATTEDFEDVRNALDEAEIMDVMSVDRKSTRLNSSHIPLSRMPSSA